MYTHRYFISDFIEIQRQSFFKFLETGILEEFSKRNPITNINKDLELFFYPEYYQLTKPQYNTEQAIFKNKSYVSKLYVPAQLTDKKRKKIYLKWVLIGHLPLMTKRGHFIINGAARIIVNQIVRSPGVYFHEKMHEIYINKWNEKPDISAKRHYADIICLRGSWLRIEIDREKCVWAQMKKGPKVPLLWLLIAMGLSERMILQSVTSSERLVKSFLPKSISKTQKEYIYVKQPTEAWKQLYLIMNAPKNREIANAAELGRKWLFKKFMNPRTYDLGKEGRLSLNKKLGLTISPKQNTLTAQDLLAITDYLMRVEKGLNPIDDIDHLKNRRVRSSGELIQIQFGIGLLRLEKIIREKLANLDALDTNLAKNYRIKNKIKKNTSTSFKQTTLINRDTQSSEANASVKMIENKSSKTVVLDNNFIIHNKSTKLPERKTSFKSIRSKNSGKFKSLFQKSSVIPTLNYLINTRPVNGALKEFFGSNPLSQFMDQINPLSEMTHKRRLSSLGIGGVTRDTATLAIRGIHPTHYGRICPIETPEGKNTGLVNSMTTYAKINLQGLILTPFYKVYKGQVQTQAGMIYLTAEQEEKMKVATADLRFSEKDFLPKGSIPSRLGKDFRLISRNDVDYVGVSPLQMISVATSLIPFLEHDDANRALMGSNMQRQAVPLIRPERAFVGTGLEARAVSDSGHALLAKSSGLVTYVSGSKITIYSGK